MDIKQFVTALKSKFNIKFLDIHADAKFSSGFDTYRSQIRMDMVHKYSPLLSSSEKRNILNLNVRPSVENLFFSVSHNKVIGGYAACDQRVGFDLEQVDRISLETVARVCSKEEISACPDAKMLWSAKEAAFKACEKGIVISDCEILSWAHDGEIFYFEGRCRKLAKKTEGALIIHDKLTVACAFAR